jgi:hypothetical protein
MKITRAIDGATLQRLQAAVISTARQTVVDQVAERDATIAALTARLAALETAFAKLKGALA